MWHKNNHYGISYHVGEDGLVDSVVNRNGEICDVKNRDTGLFIFNIKSKSFRTMLSQGRISIIKC